VSLKERTIQLKSIFTSLVEALEISDPYTRGHSDRVASLSVALGLEIGLNNRELEILQDAGTLHDIGKIGVSKEILNKPGALTPNEYEQVKQHVIFGYNILAPLELPELLEITLHHHERLDGRGYPDGLNDYPLLVRVLQIADVWDALTSDRPYRSGMSFMQARELMNLDDNSFSFDADLLAIFLKMTVFIFPDEDVEVFRAKHARWESERTGRLERLVDFDPTSAIVPWTVSFARTKMPA
jgi:HD-GYP domain-containing protein (c-di-GMP phosphodiesterase class II)